MIYASALRKSFSRDGVRIDAVDGVDLTVDDGEFVAVIGASGSGKSTLMNILGLLSRPDSGVYRLDGADALALSDRRQSFLRSRTIGFVFQNYNLVPRLTALENVELPMTFRGIPRRERLALSESALEAVGLSERMSHYPSEMSGGQQQRVSIARAFAGSPKLLLADEPTGNLDSESACQILELLRAQHRSGTTIILITHDGSVAASADRIIRISNGKIIADSSFTAFGADANT